MRLAYYANEQATPPEGDEEVPTTKRMSFDFEDKAQGKESGGGCSTNVKAPFYWRMDCEQLTSMKTRIKFLGERHAF